MVGDALALTLFCLPFALFGLLEPPASSVDSPSVGHFSPRSQQISVPSSSLLFHQCSKKKWRDIIPATTSVTHYFQTGEH
jgi:hypothetical protein